MSVSSEWTGMSSGTIENIFQTSDENHILFKILIKTNVNYSKWLNSNLYNDIILLIDSSESQLIRINSLKFNETEYVSTYEFEE